MATLFPHPLTPFLLAW